MPSLSRNSHMNGASAARVLIVEDNILVAFDARETLESAACEIVGVARDAVTAMKMAEKSPPDIAVVDFDLGGDLDGVSAARQLSQQYGTRIIFATGFGEDVIRYGYDFSYQLIIKPFVADDLIDALNKVRSKLCP